VKNLIISALSAIAAVVSLGAQAANVNDNVSVNVSLTPVCTMTTPSAISVAYTSFQTGTAVSGAGQGTFTVKCTTNLPYKVGFDAGATPAVTKTVAAAANNLQLGYDLDLVGTADGTGTGTTGISLRVRATIGANQSGTCAVGAGCTGTAENHAVYVVY
jgi:spore coat protein U-like protein